MFLARFHVSVCDTNEVLPIRSPADVTEANMILTRVRPSYWIPTLELVWTILTFCTAKCNSAGSIYAIRFLVGLAESGFYPGMVYVIGSWYRKDELAKRSCIFHTSSAIGSMFSGYLMAGVYHLGGRGGFHGWQWLFIVNGIISLPVALSGYVLLPDVPETTRAWYFNASERAFAKKRMELEGRAQRAPYTKAKFVKIFTSWRIYFLATLYMLFNNAASGVGQPTFAQFLKDSTHPKYTISQINVYPTATYGVQIVSTLIYAWTSDSIFRGARWPPIIFGGVINIVCYASLAVWNIPVGWHWACYILAGCGGGLSGLCMAWAHEICSDDNEERAIVTGTMNEIAYVFQAWLPLVVWQQVDAPQYHRGFVTSACLSAAMIVCALSIRVIWKRELAAKQKKLNLA